MRQRTSPLFANVVLAVGVTLTVAAGIGFALFYQPGTVPSRPLASAAADLSSGEGQVYLKVPPAGPAPSAVPPAPQSVPAAAPAPSSQATIETAPTAPAPPPALDPLPSQADSEPYEPPPPPMVAAAPMPDAPSPPGDAAIGVKQGGSRALRTVDAEAPDVDAVPDRDATRRAVTMADRERRAAAVDSQRSSRKTIAANEAPRAAGANAKGGPKLSPIAATAGNGPAISGPAIVTSALELNVDGRPLKLYGLKSPAATDMCAPNPDHAARFCPDVSRDVLATLLGPDNRVICRVLAVGARAALPAVCTDDKGSDLGTYLVARGFALADGDDTVDYSGAEKQARNDRLGLWHYR